MNNKKLSYAEKKQKIWWVIATAIFAALFIICTLVASPFLLGMEITYSLISTVLFRVGYVFFGLAIMMIIFSKLIMAWLNDN